MDRSSRQASVSATTTSGSSSQKKSFGVFRPKPKRNGSSMREIPCGPLVIQTRLFNEQPDDLAEAEGDDGEIVAAQPQHWDAEQDARESREAAADQEDSANGRWMSNWPLARMA